MKPDKIYMDNDLLVRWFLYKFHQKKFKDEPQITKFLSEHSEIKKFISSVSVAELVKTLKYGEDFKKFNLEFDFIIKLVQELQNIIGFNIIEKETISPNIIKFVDKHEHVLDCIHVDLAKSNDLFFITHEKNIGRIKELYEKIMTDDKLMKQYR